MNPKEESQLDIIERLAAEIDEAGPDKWQAPLKILRGKLSWSLFRPGGEIYELRRDLEVAYQANSEISKHNQELSKENERLRCPAPKRLAEYIKWIDNNSAFVVNHLGSQSEDAGFVAIHNWLKAMVK